MAPPRDLRDWIALLEREGELVRVSAEVDPHLEVTEIVDRVVKAGGPALLFERPSGAQHPLLINQFGTERRMCLAFGVDSLDDVGRRLGDVLEMQPPQGLAEKVRGLKKLKSIADSQPKSVRSGAVQEVVLTGNEVDLRRLPVQTCWPGDAGPFITLPAVITKDPRTGGRNVGMYRLQVLDERTTAMHWQIHKDGRADYLLADGKLEVAVALGLDPVTAYAASAPLPKHVDELMLAGFLRGEPVELVPGKTVDLEVPANAEIVLEGYLAKDELTEEGPFGDHTGYYTPPEPFPVFHVTAMTMRRDAIYPSIVVGKPPQEDAWLGKATERIFLPAIRMSVHDYEEVFFRVGANVDPKRDVLISEGPLDHLDHAPTLQFYGGKLGIDATHKGPAEGAREWPPEIEMSDEIRRRVDERWAEYGLGEPAGADGRGAGALRQLLRR
jgi:4-hydroxy-3-polyprenylbenzoate decarboxylase